MERHGQRDRMVRLQLRSPLCTASGLVPQMGKNIRYGHEHGLRGYHAESVYNWGEGPKLYLTMKLLWDPSLDVDDVLAEWYERSVGVAAAPELAAYYAHWEDFWTRRVLQSSFVRGESVWGGMWLPFARVGYLDVVTEEDLSRSREWLEAAVAKAVTPQQQARAMTLLRAFEHYEASALTRWRRRVRQPRSLRRST